MIKVCRSKLFEFAKVQCRIQTLIKIKLAIIVRSDLGMSKGKIGAQCAHAAVGCYKRGLIETPKLIKSWENCGQPKVVLKVDSEQSLFELKREADSFGIVTSLICDSGRSQVTPGTYTVLGIGPDLETRVNKVTGELKLF